MPLFKCTKCGCVESTALSRYWVTVGLEKAPPMCSGCDPKSKGWHGEFPQEPPVGYKLCSDGFLYEADQLVEGGHFHHLIQRGDMKIVGDA